MEGCTRTRELKNASLFVESIGMCSHSINVDVMSSREWVLKTGTNMQRTHTHLSGGRRVWTGERKSDLLRPERTCSQPMYVRTLI